MNVAAVKRPVIKESMRIGGKKVDAEGVVPVHYPYTNEVIGTVPAMVALSFSVAVTLPVMPTVPVIVARSASVAVNAPAMGTVPVIVAVRGESDPV